MPGVVGVVFHSGGKLYYFDPGDLELLRGEQVVVQTVGGTEIGEVVDPPHEVAEEDILAPLKRVVRKASARDLEMVAGNEALRSEAMATCRELIRKHGLPMKLVDAEIVFGGGKILFSFYSEERVDFRALVADLARALKMRIELRQIGAREEARMIGGLGPCGRHLCCREFNVGQDPVSIRMAKEQSLPLNPMKISGLCGRLMCCLKYEQDQYVCFRKAAPKCGTRVGTPEGEATVVGYKVPKEALTVRYEDGSLADLPINDCSCGGKPCGAAASSSDAGAVALSGNGQSGQGAPPVAGGETPGAAPAGTGVSPAIAGPSEAEAAAPEPPTSLESGAAAMTEAGDCVDCGPVEVLVGCDIPVWEPGTAGEGAEDVSRVEDQPEEPPLGAEIVVAAVEDPAEALAAAAEGSSSAPRQGTAAEPGGEGSAQPGKSGRRRRRRRPRGRGGTGGGSQGGSAPGGQGSS